MQVSGECCLDHRCVGVEGRRNRSNCLGRRVVQTLRLPPLHSGRGDMNGRSQLFNRQSGREPQPTERHLFACVSQQIPWAESQGVAHCRKERSRPRPRRTSLPLGYPLPVDDTDEPGQLSLSESSCLPGSTKYLTIQGGCSFHDLHSLWVGAEVGPGAPVARRTWLPWDPATAGQDPPRGANVVQLRRSGSPARARPARLSCARTVLVRATE